MEPIVGAECAEVVRGIEELEARLLDGVSELKRMKRAIAELTRTRQLIREQHMSPEDTAVIMTQHDSIYEKEILAAITATGHRLTFKPLCDVLKERGRQPHEQTTKRYLKSLKLAGLIDNRHDCDPLGYGLVQWNH